MQSPGLRKARKWSASLRMRAVKRPQFYRAWWTERWRRNTTHALPGVATRFVLMGVLWVTWQLQLLGTAASFPARVGVAKWLGGRPPVRQTGRDLAELHSVVVDGITCAEDVFDDHVPLDDGVPRARTSAVRACRATLEFAANIKKFTFLLTQGSRGSPGVALL